MLYVVMNLGMFRILSIGVFISIKWNLKFVMWMVKFDGDIGVGNSCRGCFIILIELFILFF